MRHRCKANPLGVTRRKEKEICWGFLFLSLAAATGCTRRRDEMKKRGEKGACATAERRIPLESPIKRKSVKVSFFFPLLLQQAARGGAMGRKLGKARGLAPPLKGESPWSHQTQRKGNLLGFPFSFPLLLQQAARGGATGRKLGKARLHAPPLKGESPWSHQLKRKSVKVSFFVSPAAATGCTRRRKGKKIRKSKVACATAERRNPLESPKRGNRQRFPFSFPLLLQQAARGGAMRRKLEKARVLAPPLKGESPWSHQKRGNRQRFPFSFPCCCNRLHAAAQRGGSQFLCGGFYINALFC